MKEAVSFECVEKSLSLLRTVAETFDSALVSFSGGKDSLCCLDLALRTFKKVVCFYMYWADGLSWIEESLQRAEKTYGVEIIQVPHWSYVRMKKYGIYCLPSPTLHDAKIADVYEYLRAETGIYPVIVGGKKADGIWRRTFVANSNADMILNPIWDWNKYDVLAYLKAKNISIPVSEGTICSGVDVSSKFLKWCYVNYPKDFEKMKEEFPFIEALIYKEQYFGKKDSKTGRQQ